jgi:regulator of replication initiation timing
MIRDYLRENGRLVAEVERLRAGVDGCVTAIENLRAERNALRERLRETAQILIAEVGAEGPMDAEDAAREAVARMERLRGLADEKAHEAGRKANR